MATRQNKKRKGVRNVINRERTVTTLTAGPESAFLIPTTTEEPGAALMSAPFPVSSSAGGGPNMQQPAFPMAPNFAPFSYNSYMPGQGFVPQHQPQHFFQPEPNLPPGQNDLEVLEKLKETIKSGQHELFQPVPQPAALASLFLGPKYVSRVPPHPEQVPVDYPQRHFDESAHHNDIPSNPANVNSAASNVPEQDNRLPSQSSQAWDGSRKPAPQPAGDSKIADNVLNSSNCPVLVGR
ncbi:uncharacterized protein LAESUDRAFT_658263 [Laetiporus sulphureus 93-53]|uniref:Uncharacterized protein n=1 Tax=Laetiporus sulphureus 93-53 TaxID=1314785 RepID=A0A165D654_9APHY|nr:uncharacterized protein LAESUDRAFT_658263 [Laetiporus sulphureus 93-53]KZT04222.1 hypothetical protein LAESUDRAFT_658263 [Laetiporus sulphureus 93-53]